nr:MAG TPA: hypothetical protein [Caudoviricetes sp.]
MGKRSSQRAARRRPAKRHGKKYNQKRRGRGRADHKSVAEFGGPAAGGRVDITYPPLPKTGFSLPPLDRAPSRQKMVCIGCALKKIVRDMEINGKKEVIKKWLQESRHGQQ